MLDPRLTALLEARVGSADRASLDEEIWRAFGQQWCIMATDLSGFSRAVAAQGIIALLQTIHESSQLLIPIVESNDGRLLKMEGDSFLVIFADVHQGLRASVEMQRAVRRYNDRRAEAHPTSPVLLGIGLGYGRVLRAADDEVYGNEVNSACILGETYAQGYDILVTQAVRDAARDFEFEEFSFVPPGAGGAYRVRYAG